MVRRSASIAGATSVTVPTMVSARGDPRALQMMRDLVAHHIGLLQNLARERIGGVRGGLVDDDRQRRLDGVGEIADMGARALDDFAVGVDQRIGLARQRRDLDRKFAFEPFGAAGADIGDRFRNALQRRKPEADLEDRGQQQHDRRARQRCRRGNNRSCAFRRKSRVASPATLTRNLPSAPRSTGRSTIRRLWPSGPST